MRRIREWIQPLRPADLFSVPVMLGVTLEYVLVLLASPYNVPGSALISVLIQVLTVGMTLALLFAVYLALRRRIPDDSLRVVLIACLPLMALLSGALQGWVRFRLGLDPVSLIYLRTLTAVMHISAIALLLWAAVSGIRLHYIRLGRLTEERDRLAALDSQATHGLAELDTAATETVRTRILDSLSGASSADVSHALTVLTATLEDTVRPLSRQLESQSEEWVAPVPKPDAVQRIDWRAAASEGTDPAIMSPLGVLVIVTLMATPMNLARVGLLFAMLFIVLTFAVALPLAYVIRQVSLRMARGWMAVVQAAAFIAMSVLIGIMWALVLLPITWETPQPWRFVYLCPLFVLVVSYIWGIAVAAQRQALATEISVRAASEDLAWSTAVSRELHRQRRRALAHAVHGEVQAALAAGILELERAKRDGAVTQTFIDGICGRIVTCVRNLDLRNVHPIPLKSVTAKVQATWSDVMTLSVAVDPTLGADIEKNSRCLLTLSEVIPELVFNSIKHGRATTITVSVEVHDYRTICLAALDNGSMPASGEKSGMGSRLFETCAIHWSRASTGQGTLTTMLLPFAPTTRDALAVAG